MIGNLYKIVYVDGELSAVYDVEKDISREKFIKKFKEYNIAERNKIYAQTIMSENELKKGTGVAWILMNPAYGCYLVEEDINLHLIKARKRTRNES